jgi:hypothetical protein
MRWVPVQDDHPADHQVATKPVTMKNRSVGTGSRLAAAEGKSRRESPSSPETTLGATKGVAIRRLPPPMG